MTTLIEAVDAAVTGIPRMYRLNQVPAKPTYPYGSYSAALGGGSGYTLDSRHGARSGLVTVQTFGKTEDSATALMESVVAALLDRSLTFASYRPSTPLRAALDQIAVNRDPDDNGVVTATMPFAFTAAKETS